MTSQTGSTSFEYEYVRVERDGWVAVVTIDRPKALNALNAQVLDELASAFSQIGTSEVRAVILTGGGEKSFVAGGDIAEMNAMTPDEALAYAQKGHALMDQIESLPQPVIAAVNGYALGGGCELALACDIIYASEKARFGQPEVNLGIMPGFGGAVRLPRKVGAGAASEWIFTGEMYTASQAQAIGLVRDVLPPDALIPRCKEIAALIGTRGPKAVAASKRVLTEGMGIGTRDAASMECKVFSELFLTEDMREGPSAFVEKREPSFKGA
ncbi:MAG: enoyl-CoA hydratase-related protein [Myxococcota bacterium]